MKLLGQVLAVFLLGFVIGLALVTLLEWQRVIVPATELEAR